MIIPDIIRTLTSQLKTMQKSYILKNFYEQVGQETAAIRLLAESSVETSHSVDS